MYTIFPVNTTKSSTRAIALLWRVDNRLINRVKGRD